jgi:hypothetical protein
MLYQETSGNPGMYTQSIVFSAKTSSQDQSLQHVSPHQRPQFVLTKWKQKTDTIKYCHKKYAEKKAYVHLCQFEERVGHHFG